MTPTTMPATVPPLDDVLDGVSLAGGRVNTPDDTLRAHIEHAIRQGHPQMHPRPVNGDRVCLVGSGPSLNDTLDELIELYYAGARIVTVNRSYHWCLQHNLRPSAHVVVDARPSSAEFVTPLRPRCIYYIASQCHPSVWAAVQDYPQVEIFHAVTPDDALLVPVLDAYYGDGHWAGVGGGTTVMMRALGLLRTLGYLRFDLFGFDSCFKGDDHHAFAQPENQHDRALRFSIAPGDRPELARTFSMTPWMLKQFEDFWRFFRLHKDNFLLNVHGDGAIAFALASQADDLVVKGLS